MNRKLIGIVLMPMLMLFAVSSAFGQTGNNVISNGQPVGGGGSSSSAAYTLTGSVPLTSGMPMGSSGNEIMGGTIGISYSLQPYSALEFTYSGSALQTVPFGEAKMIEIDITAGTGADTAGTIFARPFGSTSWTTFQMTLDQTVLSYNIPAGNFDMRGMEYYIRVAVGNDTAWVGSSTTPYVFVTSMDNAEGQRPAALPNASYRIIGLPINPSSHSVSAVFDDDLGAYDNTQWRLASYNAGTETYEEHAQADPVYPGQGYWLIVRGGGRYGSAGTCVRPTMTHSNVDYYRVELDQGWNILANPFGFDVSWSDVLFDDNGTISGHDVDILDDVVYSYNGSSYTTLNGIRDWEGVFVYIKKSGVDALIRCRAASVSKTVPPVERMSAEDNWAVNVRLEVGGLADDYNLVGVRPGALGGADEFDYMEPPPAPDGPRLGFKQNGDRGLRRTDFRPPFEDGAVWEIELERAAGGVLTFDGVSNIPENMTAWIKMSGCMTAVVDEDAAIVVPDNVTSLQLIIGTEKYLSDDNGMVMPGSFVLEQNVPNPFNPITNINFTLPEAGYVRLEVFNILGQSIRVLTDEELPAGYHTAVWDGTENNGGETASGIYFYRIEYDQYNLTRKMLLLK